MRKNPEYHEFLSRVCLHLDGCAGKVVYAGERLWTDWRMHAIGQRHFRLAIDDEPDGHNHAIGYAESPASGAFSEPVIEHSSWALFRASSGPDSKTHANQN